MTSRSTDELADDTLINNSNYKNDVNHTMQLLHWTLTPIGIVPLLQNRVSKRKKIFSVLAAFTCFCLMIVVLAPCLLSILVYEKDIYVKIKLYGPTSFFVTSTIKYCFLGLKGKHIKRCIARIENDWKYVERSYHRDIMMKQVSIARGLAIASAAFLYSGGISYQIIVPLLSGKRIHENVTIRPLMFPSYDGVFDLQVSPTYEIMLGIQWLCATSMQTITIATCSLAATFVTHACGQIQIIVARLNDLVEGNSSVNLNVDQRFAVIIKDHVRVLRFARQIEKVLREICLIEFITSALIICLIAYYCIMEWDNGDTVAILTYFMLLISFTFNTFIFCYIGELLVNQCRNIGVVSYSIEWYRLTGKKSLGLILIIAISNYPPKITAGKIVELSLYTFNSVLKSSMVYLNLLRAVVT